MKPIYKRVLIKLSGEALGENGQFLTYEAPHFPGDMPGRWFGFHYHDYSVDTFH